MSITPNHPPDLAQIDPPCGNYMVLIKTADYERLLLELEMAKDAIERMRMRIKELEAER